MKDLKYSILINNASKQFGERGFECILGVVLVLGSLVLALFFPLFGIAIALVAAPFLCVGLKRYLISIAKGKTIAVEGIYGAFKHILTAFCLKVAYTLICLLWGVVFIIPGIICALNYGLASFVLAEDPNATALECMAKSKKLIYGNRFELFIIYLSYFFVTVAVMCIFTALGIAINNFTTLPLWVSVVSMIIAFLFVLVVFIIPYFELVLTNVYLKLKEYSEKNTTKKSTTKTNSQKEKTISVVDA